MKYKEIMVTLRIPVVQENDELDLIAAFKNADFETAICNLEFGSTEENNALDIQDGVEIVSVNP